MENNRPKVWVWVIVHKDWKILLGKRKNATWEGCRAFPWWHLEFGEEIEDCARREVMEEVWITIKNIKVGHFTNDIFQNENKHYITIFAICEYDQWTIENKEPEKCESWELFAWDNLPSNLFAPINNFLKHWYSPL